MTPNRPQLLLIRVKIPAISQAATASPPFFFSSYTVSQVLRTWAEEKAIKLMQHGCHKVVDISRVEQFTTWKKRRGACIKHSTLSQIYYAFSWVICDTISGRCQ